MIITIYFILKGIINSVNEKGKEYFALKLSELDKNNNQKNENKEEKEEEPKNEVTTVSETPQGNGSIVLYQSKDVDDIDVKDVLQLVKKIDTKFNYDDRYIVDEFVKQTKDDNNREKYDKLTSIKKYIEKIGIYNLIIADEDTIQNFKNEVSKIDEDIITTYEKINEKFDIENFIAYLDIEIKKNDPAIYVMVGNKNISFDDLGERVKTIYREEVYKGIKILYKGNVYDYSLG